MRDISRVRNVNISILLDTNVKNSIFLLPPIDKDTRFKRKELREIRKASMSRIICDNTYGLTMIQPEAFKNANPRRNNPMVSCNDSKKIKSLDLSLFKGI